MSKMIRTFICVDLSSNLKARLDSLTLELQKQSTTRVSWVKATNMHLTLRFLGDVAEDKIPNIQACIEQAGLGVKSFNLSARELGAFPNLNKPRVFWVGIKDLTNTLLPMQKRLEQGLVNAGFGPSDHPFSPHLTIGRVKEGNGQDIASKLSKIEFVPEDFSVKETILMRSDLKPSGTVYSKLALIKLAQ
jgi:RNA 2',3'-cyclic 3'-phosphodiesterase